LPSDEVETGGEEADVAEPLTSPSEEATTDGNVGLPDVEEDPETELSEMEVELRGFFQELIDAGVEPSTFMDDPRWEDLNERAIAEGVETWPILLQMTAMG
jgi:hypothetical protein